MKLKDALDNYYSHSGKASELVRQMGLAGIAVIWLFKYELLGVPKVPAALLLPLTLIVLGLTLDFLQYVAATAIWGFYHRRKEQTGCSEEKEFKAPRELNWPALVFFWSKIVAISGAYVLLLQHLVQTIVPK